VESCGKSGDLNWGPRKGEREGRREGGSKLTLNHIFPLPASPTRLSTLFKLKFLSNTYNVLLLLKLSFIMFNILTSFRPVVSGFVFHSAVVSLTPAVWTISMILQVSLSYLRRVSSELVVDNFFSLGKRVLSPLSPLSSSSLASSSRPQPPSLSC